MTAIKQLIDIYFIIVIIFLFLFKMEYLQIFKKKRK